MVYFLLMKINLFCNKELKKLWKKTFKTIHQLTVDKTSGGLGFGRVLKKSERAMGVVIVSPSRRDYAKKIKNRMLVWYG